MPTAELHPPSEPCAAVRAVQADLDGGYGRLPRAGPVRAYRPHTNDRKELSDGQ